MKVGAGGTAHLYTFSPTKGLDFIADDFGEMEFEFALLSNISITGASPSRYMTVRQVEQAV